MEEDKTLVEVITDKILRYLKEVQLQVGGKLPDGYGLSGYLKVGRSTVRETVQTLASRNVLEVRQGTGTFVSDKRGIANDPLDFSLIEDQDRMMRDLFELRYLLEPKVTGLTAEYTTKNQTIQMKRLTQKIETPFQEGTQGHVQLGIGFHTMIAEVSGNIALLHIIPITDEPIALFNKNYDIQHLRIGAIDVHTEIVQAIERQNALATFDAMAVHVAVNRRELQKVIGEKETN